MSKTHLYLTSIIGLTFVLSACGGGGSNTSPPPPPPPAADTQAPSVSFSPGTLSVESGMTGDSTLTATDNVGVTSGPTVSCTNGGSFDVAGNTFTAATVTSETTSVCTATASDAAGNEGTATLTVTMTPPPQTITLSGIVHKGVVSGADIRILDAADGADGTPLVSGTTATDGSYSLTIPEGTQLSDMLVVEARLANAQMVCDAANCQSEGGIDFGSTFVIPPDGTGPNDVPRTLTAAVLTPPIGTTEVNVNMFSHYQLLDMVGLALQRQAQNGGEAIISSQDYASTRQNTANLFALPDADFYTIPFVDITATISSTDQDAIYAALLGGGLLGAALEAAAPFDALSIFQGQAVTDNLIANESNDNREFISVEDIYENASDVAAQIGDAGNAFTGAQSSITDRLAEISAASADRPVEPDGSLPAVFTELAFVSDGETFSTTNTGAALNIVNPDSLNYTAVIETGAGSEFFGIGSTASRQNLDLDFINVPAGNYVLGVTFDTDQGDPNTDTIELTFTAPEISIVEDSVTISKAVTDRVTLNISNPGNFQTSGATVSGTGSEFFLVAGPTGGNSFELSLNGANPVPDGTYNLTFEIETTTVGASGTDTVEVIVAP